MLVSSTPALECGPCQILVGTRVITEKTIQRLQSPGGGREPASQRPFQVHILLKHRRERRRKQWGGGHGRTPLTAVPLPGTESETPRKSPVARRRYIDVLSAVR
jgi:hypothetical protein